MPGSDGRSLAKQLGSRDPKEIVKGLSTILGKQAERLERAFQLEEDLDDGLSPETTKLAQQVFAQGEKMAKLLDPALRGGANVQVNVGGMPGKPNQITTDDPKQLIAGIVQEFERQGWKREDITEPMIRAALSGASIANMPKIIESGS